MTEPAADARHPTGRLPLHDRPRERLRAVGVRNLALRELIALIVGSGSSRASALEVAGRLAALTDGSLQRLGSVDVGVLEGVSGVGAATAARILAALELGRRAAAEEGGAGGHVRGPADVFARMGPRLRDAGQEEFHALLLNSRHRVLREVLVTRGILDSALIHPREVFRPAVGEGAAGVILVHNHPSGDPTPSAEDRAVTRQLAEAGRAVGIPVLDHVVVGRGAYTSLADELGRGNI
ncbi:MAG TPA: DNA repair protein RadC [Longimicrobiales bacterium]|nr:DNA repair protein RadC [Longimicrobiales bacterium]